jgi:hypothetical protein
MFNGIADNATYHYRRDIPAMKHDANYRMSDDAPLYGCAILAAIAIIATVAVVTLIYGALHGVSPL